MVKLGKTGKFPEGKLNRRDEGEIKIGVSNRNGAVIINFGVPVTWIGMPPDTVRSLAKMLLKHADITEENSGKMLH